MPRQRIALLLAAALAITIGAVAIAALTSGKDESGRDINSEARQAEDRLIAQIESGQLRACERVSGKLEKVFERMLKPPAESIEGLRAVRIRTRVMYWMIAGQVTGGTGDPQVAVWAADDIVARNRVFAVDDAARQISKWAGTDKMEGENPITPDEYGYRAAKLCMQKALSR